MSAMGAAFVVYMRMRRQPGVTREISSAAAKPETLRVDAPPSREKKICSHLCRIRSPAHLDLAICKAYALNLRSENIQ